MIAVGMMEPALDEVIRMIAVRYGFVSATRSVGMLALGRGGLAAIGIGGVHRQCVLVVMTLVRVVQVAVVQVVDMVTMTHGHVAAARAVHVLVVVVVSLVAVHRR